MLTVMELLSFPLFRDFKLVSGYSGLYNQVTGTGILEWESPNDVERNFEHGEFVVTTLSVARGDSSLAENNIRTLIDKKVSAIAVKDIYYHEISDELKAYSDVHHIPVFFFSETFFDDIIYTIKNTLLTYNRDFALDDQIEFLLEETHSPEQIKKKAKEINPFFHSNIICCYLTLKKNNIWQKELKALQLNPSDTVYSIVRYQQGVLVIYTAKDFASEEKASKDFVPVLEAKLLSFLEKSGLRKYICEMGISNIAKGLENLGKAIQECLFANSSCKLNQMEILRFQDSGLDQILMPLEDNPWMKEFYRTSMKKLTDYDTLHSSRLLDTLLEYVKNDGDVNRAAQQLFQHSNTIRYRIGKIQILLNLGDSSNSFTQLFVLVRLHQIYQIKESD